LFFNSNLKNNDGLLANQIATAQNINYSAALEQINGFVQQINAALKKGEKVKIDMVGTLYLDVERNIQFKPSTTNFLIDSFGLTEYQSPAIKRDTVAKRVEKELKKEGNKIIGIDAAPKRKINIKRLVAVAASVTLVAGIFWVSLKTDVLKNVNYANLNPFNSKPAVNDTIVIWTHKKADTETPVTNKVDSSNSIIVEPVTATLIKKAEPVKADSTAVIKNNAPEKTNYHLVTGCFQIKENALKLVNTLRKENINAAIIGKNNKGLYVVSCGDFSSEKEAHKGLKNLREAQPNAWLYKSN